MLNANPQFPPLLSGRQVVDGDPFRAAVEGARAGKLEAGDLLWSLDNNEIRFAVCLEPEVARTKCYEIVFTMMVAFGDAFGVLSPPEVSITHDWPNVILANGGELGGVSVALSEGSADQVPDWMVAGLFIRMAPDGRDPEAGFTSHRTTLWDEGCAEIDAAELLEASARHFLAWVHIWEEDGFRPVHETWSGRMAERSIVTVPHGGENLTGTPIGLDEHGGLLLRCGEGTRLLDAAGYFGAEP